MEKLDSIIMNIYQEMRDRNYDNTPESIPLSDDFFPHISKKYGVLAFSVPKLIQVLVDSRMIFSMEVVSEERKNKILGVNGFIVTEGNILAKLRKVYEDKLIHLYSQEFHKKTTIEKIIRDLVPKLDELNNTPIGRTANIVLMIEHYSSVLARNIMDYSKKVQEKIYAESISQLDESTIFARTDNAKNTETKKEESNKSQTRSRRAADSDRYQEFKQYSNKHSIEKTLTLYGVDFYTRVCFRDYNFSIIEKLIQDGNIRDQRDLLVIKKYLKRERANSDQDLKLQKYANQINSLEKTINSALQNNE